MPRRPRIHLAGVPLHSVQRGHNHDVCFFGEEDSLAYPHGLGEALKGSGYALHAYVLIEQPWALAADSTAAPKNVPRLIISLGRGYVQYINKTYHRTGTLWDSRYTSSLVQEDPLLTAVPTLYRAQPRACLQGGRPGALPLEQLP